MKKTIISLILLTLSLVVLTAYTLFKPVGGGTLKYHTIFDIKTIVYNENLSIPLEYKSLAGEDPSRKYIFTDKSLTEIMSIANNLELVNTEIYNNNMLLINIKNDTKTDYYLFADRTLYFDLSDKKYNGYKNAIYGNCLIVNFENSHSDYLLPIHLLKDEEIIADFINYSFKFNNLYETNYGISDFESFYKNTGAYSTEINENILTIKLKADVVNDSTLNQDEFTFTFSNDNNIKHVSFNC